MSKSVALGCLLWAICFVTSTSRGDTPLSIRIELDASRKPPSIDINAPFRIVLTNTSNRPVSVWNPRIHEGYYQVSFHFLNLQTHVEHVARKRQIQDPKFWSLLARDESGSEVIQIAPHRDVGFKIQFDDFAWGQLAWTGLPDPNSSDRLSISAEIESKRGASERGASVWIGHTRSPAVVGTLVSTRMRTPHDYLWNGFPNKALEVMKADHTWISREDDEHCTPLHHAARFGYPGVVKWLLDNGADVNAIAYNGFTPLHLADRRDVITVILDKHPNLNICDSAYNQTPPQRAAERLVTARSESERREWLSIAELYAKAGGGSDLLTAVKLGDLARVKAILSKSPELADNFQHQSLLRTAASSGHFEICRYLIGTHRVDVNDFERLAGYPIIKGALKYPQIVRLLIEHGADLKTRITWQGARSGVWIIGDDATILHFAAEDGVPETIKLLLDHDVDPFAKTKSLDGREQEQTAIDVGAIFGKADNVIAMLDHPSFQRASLATRKCLLNRCLVLAASSIAWSHEGEPSKLIEALLTRGADPDARSSGLMAVPAAAQKMWPGQDKQNQLLKDEIAALMKHGAQLDLFSAVAIGDERQVLRLLAQNPGLANSRDGCGHPALHLAIGMNYGTIVKRLLEAGGDVEIRNRCDHIGDLDDTPLHEAAFWGRYEIAQQLIAKGANVNSTSRKEWTPLHDAVYVNHVNVARLLLEKGAKSDAKNRDGETPLALARKNRDADVSAIEALFEEYRLNDGKRARK